ncbi:PREDICTED: arylacetamide deacetylase [Nanorana parkeri]|uniref:arylacetamide deacetylase n=1 Tax=Nanorana parkeri TaxID=125878 RepID=UPI000854F253|nr:PREDICTED: arylacetamide deacetylase [Nanorana parkeri]
MASKSVFFVLVTVLLAYYIYKPLPDNVEEKFKVMLLDATFRTLGHAGYLAELLGVTHYMDVMMLLTKVEHTEPISDENVTVTDTSFSNVPVRLYVPKRQSEGPRRAVIYIHGGGWCLGSAAMKPYDLLSRKTAHQLSAVVVSINYRLAPKFHFPTQFDDVYAVVRFFLQKSILDKYSVDPNRIAVSGDSAGGNLAAAITQTLFHDPEVKVKLRIQALIYPVLQTLDLYTPSYRENGNMPLLSRTLMVRFWSEYFTTDQKLFKAMLSNRYIPSQEAHLFKFVNWSTLLPNSLKNNHVYHKPEYGDSSFVKKYPGILDIKSSPLLQEDENLKGLPLTYVLTCMYDVLRDDGFMYASRLRQAGVQVVHHHYDSTFHGILLLNTLPFDFAIAHHISDKYLMWLDSNL